MDCSTTPKYSLFLSNIHKDRWNSLLMSINIQDAVVQICTTVLFRFILSELCATEPTLISFSPSGDRKRMGSCHIIISLMILFLYSSQKTQISSLCIVRRQEAQLRTTVENPFYRVQNIRGTNRNRSFLLSVVMLSAIVPSFHYNLHFFGLCCSLLTPHESIV